MNVYIFRTSQTTEDALLAEEFFEAPEVFSTLAKARAALRETIAQLNEDDALGGPKKLAAPVFEKGKADHDYADQWFGASIRKVKTK